MTTLPEDYLLFINLCFYAVFFFFCFFFLLPLYYSDGDILLVLFRQRLILAVSPIFSFTSLSPTFFFFFFFLLLLLLLKQVVSLAFMFVLSHFGSLLQPLLMLLLPTIDFVKCY